MPESSFLIGSHANVPETTLSVTANSVSEDVTVAAGAYYVDDPTASLSLIQTMATAIAGHSEISTCTASIREDCIVRVTADIAFTLTFGGTIVRQLVGSTGNWNTSQATQVGDEVSRYIWVPGKQEHNVDSPIGTEGRRVYDVQVARSGPGEVESTMNNYAVHKDLEWRFVTQTTANRVRVWDSNESPGQYISFFRNVLANFYSFKHYTGLTNDESSTTDVTLTSPFGPYVLRSDRVEEEYDRAIQFKETYAHVQLPAVNTSEYS